MSTVELSKIKTARPAKGTASYPCTACQGPIYRGQEYFSYQSGQRSSYAYCLKCCRTPSTGEPSTWQSLYRDRYGPLANVTG